MIRTTLSICALFGCMVVLAGMMSKPATTTPVSETSSQPEELRQARPGKNASGERLSLKHTSGLGEGMLIPTAGDEGTCAIPAGHIQVVSGEEESPLISLEPTPVQASKASEEELKPLDSEKPVAKKAEKNTASDDNSGLPANPIRGKGSNASSRRTEQMVALRGGRRSNPSEKEKEPYTPDRGPGGNAPLVPGQETGPKPSLSEDSSLGADDEMPAEGKDSEEDAATDDVKKSEVEEKPAKDEETSEAVKPSEEPAPLETEGSPLKPLGPEKPLLKAADQPEPLSPELLELHERLQDALAYYYQRPENVATRSPWGAMHAMIAYGVDSELIAGNRKVNAIGWLCFNGTCNGQRLFYTDRGQLVAQIGPGVQGHAGQFLSMLAQSRVTTDYPIRVDSQNFSVASLIEYEKQTCRPKTELTFKLIALSHYLKSDEQWKSNDMQDWSVSRLIKEELAQPIVGAACGGTHRLTGLSYAVKKRKQRGEPIEGQWHRADKFIQEFHEYTFRLQNPDGSFSTEWFKGRGNDGPPSRRLETTGHTTEWLTFSLSDAELRDPKMVKSISYLTNLLLEGRNEKWSIGPLGHGLHALAIYDERVFGNKPGTRKLELASRRVMPTQPVRRY